MIAYNSPTKMICVTNPTKIRHKKTLLFIQYPLFSASTMRPLECPYSWLNQLKNLIIDYDTSFLIVLHVPSVSSVFKVWILFRILYCLV